MEPEGVSGDRAVSKGSLNSRDKLLRALGLGGWEGAEGQGLHICSL